MFIEIPNHSGFGQSLVDKKNQRESSSIKFDPWQNMHGFTCAAVCDIITTMIITITISIHLLCDRLQLVPKDVHHHVEGVEGEPGGEEDDTDCDQQQICSTSPCQFSCKPKQQQKIEEM